MAKITCKQPANFTGHIGLTAFRDGEGETEVATALAFFKRHPERFDVEGGEEKPKRRRSRKPKDDGKDADKGSDEQPEDDKGGEPEDADKGEDEKSSDNDGE